MEKVEKYERMQKFIVKVTFETCRLPRSVYAKILERILIDTSEIPFYCMSALISILRNIFSSLKVNVVILKTARRWGLITVQRIAVPRGYQFMEFPYTCTCSHNISTVKEGFQRLPSSFPLMTNPNSLAFSILYKSHLYISWILFHSLTFISLCIT